MSYNGSNNKMRPTKDDDTIRLPVTFDYNGGRNESTKSKLLWSAIISVVGVIIGMGIMLSSEGFFLFNIIFGCSFTFIVFVVVRFFILKEHKIRDNMVSLIDKDYKTDTSNFWGIFNIDDVYPYYCHFRNGKKGIFIQFEKDVIVGKSLDAEYEHYEAIADAYNLAGEYNIKMSHIDYMDNIGNDDRLNACFDSLSNIDNEDIKDIMTDIYVYIQELMKENVSDFDVYVFTFTSTEHSFMYDMQKVISCLLEANYISFRVLDSNSLRDLAISLFNLDDLSIVDANSKAFKGDRKSDIIPIRVISSDGSIKVLNKTLDEKEKDKKQKELENKLKKVEASKKSSKVSNDVDDIDLF